MSTKFTMNAIIASMEMGVEIVPMSWLVVGHVSPLAPRRSNATWRKEEAYLGAAKSLKPLPHFDSPPVALKALNIPT